MKRSDFPLICTIIKYTLLLSDIYNVNAFCNSYRSNPNKRTNKNDNNCYIPKQNDELLFGTNTVMNLSENANDMTASQSSSSIISDTLERRELFLKCTKSVIGATTATAFISGSSAQAKTDAKRFTAFHVKTDESSELSPTLNSINGNDLLETLSLIQNNKNSNGGSNLALGGGAVWLGEHHNSLKDHVLQASIISDIYHKRRNIMGNDGDNIAIGLEMIQLKFQPVLDAYVCKQISEKTMLQEVQWESRWTWPFEVYRPIFETAREFNIKLLALNVNSEDFSLVETGGFPALGKDKLKLYINDPKGFATLASTESFKEYVNYVITPSYKMHQVMGILKDPNMSFGTFLSGRLLWDETMANTAANWCNNNPNGLLLGCVGLDHIKFSNGIPIRFSRLCANANASNISLLLNPTLTDTRPAGTVSMLANSASSADSITLQLRYQDDGVDLSAGVLPLADYLVLSQFS